MIECWVCEKPVCQHGHLRVIQLAGSKVAVTKCVHCGAGGVGEEPPVFCLPTYEGEVDWSSDVSSTVCPDCHDKAILKELTWNRQNMTQPLKG